MALVFLKEENIFNKMVYYTLQIYVRNRIIKLEFTQAKNGLF